jgi:hypothetical protein
MGEKKLKTTENTKKQKGKKEIKPAVNQTKIKPPKKEKKIQKKLEKKVIKKEDPTKDLVGVALAKPKNGIPQNPNCVWSYEELAKFFHNNLSEEINNLNSALNGVRERLSDGGDDGGNGTEELHSNSTSRGTTAGDFVKIKEEEINFLKKINFLESIKKKIEAGTFICKMNFTTFYAKNIL